MDLYRVRVHPPEKDDISYELFDNRSDADAYYRDLQKEQDNMIEGTPYDSLVISLEEMCHGIWVLESTKLVIR